MSIVTSTIVEDRIQIDGRRSIIERHVDDLGVEHLVFYLAESKEDVEAMLPIRAAQIDQQLADQGEQRAAEALADKLHAVALLKLGDQDIADILKIEVADVAATKEELEKRAEEKPVEIGAVDVGEVEVKP